MRPCIVFDLDDTLYLERDYVRSGFTAVGKWTASALRINDFAQRAWHLFENGQRERIFQTVLSGYGVDATLYIVTRMVTVYREHIPEIELLPDAAHCLRQLHGKAILGLITDGLVRCQKAKCASIRADDVFNITIFTGEWGEQFYKPHSRAFETLQSRIGADDRLFVYIGDNPSKDFRAPVSLGWTAVRIRRPGGLHFDSDAVAPEFAAHFEISDLWSVPEMVVNLSRTGGVPPPTPCSPTNYLADN
jgi:putative hydrolase of the HAD superfamily